MLRSDLEFYTGQVDWLVAISDPMVWERDPDPRATF